MSKVSIHTHHEIDLYIINIPKEYCKFTVLEVPEINKNYCVILHTFITPCLSRSFPSVSLYFVYAIMESDEDNELDEGASMSGLDFSDD